MSNAKTAAVSMDAGDAPAGHDALAIRRERLLTQLVASAAPRGLRIARDLLGDRAEAEDAVQEALARACEACDRIREPAAAAGWFYRVLTNICLRALRRRRLRRLFLGTESGAARAEVRDERDDAREPGAELAHRQDVALLMRALAELPARQRAALLLRYGHDLSVAEVAELLDVSPATAKTHLVRGLRRLRKTMERLS